MKKEIDMERMFETIPDVPQRFEEYCKSFLPKIPVFYRRNGKYADCICGKCGRVYMVGQKPVRHEATKCPICGNEGFWEWRTVTNPRYTEKCVMLIQCTKEKSLTMRKWRVSLSYVQGGEAKIKLKEIKRSILKLGDVYEFNNDMVCTSHGWERRWACGKGHEYIDCDTTFPGWEKEIERSELKYCNVNAISNCAGWEGIEDALRAFANNPAIEMYAKAGMDELVRHLLQKDGRTRLINRRAKTLNGQLRIKDRAKIKRLIAEKGSILLLKILQQEEKSGCNWTAEQEQFLKRMYVHYEGEKRVNFCLRYMSLQKLMNRIKKYKKQENEDDWMVLGRYKDYLRMREELGYDMTNEVYVYPKNLKKKHDEMVKEREARRDELYAEKMRVKYPDIAKRYGKYCKKYGYEQNGYFIRPARDAEEIIMEGRLQHHCVGGENYLRKHNDGKTVILFLRKVETPDIPYYTIEMRNNEILQWYGIRDGKPDKEIIGPYLDEYQEHLKGKVRKAG